MIDLGNKVFCSAKIFAKARVAKKATDMARRLLVGVFHKTYLMFCTVSGELGKNSKNNILSKDNVLALNSRGLDAIVGKHLF